MVFSNAYAGRDVVDIGLAGFKLHVADHGNYSEVVVNFDPFSSIGRVGQCVVLVSGVAYIAAVACVVGGRLAMRDRHAWHAWRAELSFDELLTIPHDEVYRQLWPAIQERYHVVGSSSALHEFFADTERELSRLRGYHKLGDMLSYIWPFCMFFLVTQGSVQATHERINKLLFLRSLVQSFTKKTD